VSSVFERLTGPVPVGALGVGVAVTEGVDDGAGEPVGLSAPQAASDNESAAATASGNDDASFMTHPEPSRAQGS
jgi:hypothetical protein